MSKEDWCNIKVVVPSDGSPYWREVRHWLHQNVDDRDYSIGGCPPHDLEKRIVYFALEKDAAWFKLRWM